MSIDAMKQALEAVDWLRHHLTQHHGCLHMNETASGIPAWLDKTETALRTAIEQAQEPVAWMHNFIEGNVVAHRPADLDKHPDRWKALYKTPPPCPTCEALARAVMMDQTSHDMAPRQWQGLTDEEISSLWDGHIVPVFGKNGINPIVFARAIEANLKEKNT